MEIVLYIDTSNQDMAVGLAKNEKIIYRNQYLAFRKQSEVAASEIRKCFIITGVKPDQLSKIVVSNGPGSYTGIRIGLTLAKVMAQALNIQLITVSSLHLLAGIDSNVLSIIDAKGGKVFAGFYNNGVAVKKDSLISLEEVLKIKENYKVVGDLFLLGMENEKIDIIKNMFLISKHKISVDPKYASAIYLKDFYVN